MGEALAAQPLTGDLEALSSDVARMGGLAESMVADAIVAVIRRDAALADTVVERDGRVDAAQRELERTVQRLLSARMRDSADARGEAYLREGLAVLRIAAELERVADLSKNIAKRTLVLAQAEPLALTRSIERMGRLAEAHLKQVLDAYSKRDVQMAVHVWRRDEDIDFHYNALVKELLTLMTEDAKAINPCAHLLFVAKNIERIGDHCTNIAEAVHLLVTGQEIGEERPKSDDAERGDL